MVKAESRVLSITRADAAESIVTGFILYNNEPVSSFSGDEAIFSMTDLTARQIFVEYQTLYNSANGQYALLGLPPETLRISTDINADGRDNGFAGDFEGMPAVTEIPRTGVLNLDLPVIKAIHLFSPVDNSQQLGDLRIKDTLRSEGLVFEWEPLESATNYEITLLRMREPYSTRETIFLGSVDGTKWEPILPPNAADEYYLFRINAYNKEGMRIGHFRRSNINGYGWDYNFRVSSN